MTREGVRFFFMFSLYTGRMRAQLSLYLSFFLPLSLSIYLWNGTEICFWIHSLIPFWRELCFHRKGEIAIHVPLARRERTISLYPRLETTILPCFQFRGRDIPILVKTQLDMSCLSRYVLYEIFWPAEHGMNTHFFSFLQTAIHSSLVKATGDSLLPSF